jgi:hypothetical protein
MNIVIITVLLLLVLLICLIKCGYVTYEDFSSDEAVQNVASLYNQNAMTVGDFTSTGTITGNNLNATNGTIGTLASSNQTVNGTLNVNVANVNGTLTTNATNVNGGLTVKNGLNADGATLGNTTVNGVLNATGGIQAIVLSAPNWNTAAFINQAKPYFSGNMPDGTTLRFLFVYPGTGGGAGNQNVWHANIVKLGQQILLYELQPEHDGISNLWSGQSNDLSWRGNL